jgi:membrane associated rhomboid family serine protease
LGGVAATVAHVVSDPRSTIPVVGASGAISAVMGAYVYFFPDRRLYMMIFYSLRRIRAIWYLGIWLLIQIYLATAALYRHRLATRIEALEQGGGVTR